MDLNNEGNLGRGLSKAEIDLLIQVVGEPTLISRSEPSHIPPLMSEQISNYHRKLQALIDQFEVTLESLDKDDN